MTLYQIALRNLKRRKSKMAFMLIGLILASAAVVSIFTILSTMQSEISGQLADMGANIVITADSGELSFQYGGITIPELIYDAATLTETDLDTISALPGSEAILAVAPRLIGTLEHKVHNLVIAGVQLPDEFAVKPWLRFNEDYDDPVEDVRAAVEGEAMEMNYQSLNLERVSEVPELTESEVVLGSSTAAMLELKAGDNIELAGKEYLVTAVLQATGMAEDNQVFISLTEAQIILGRPGELTVIELASDFNRVAEKTLLLQLKEALSHASVTGVRQAVMGRNELLLSLSRFGLFTGGLIFLTGILVIMLTMSAAVRERTREIGIFRAIGFRGKHIFIIITTETLLISAIGGTAGYHGGLMAARLITPLLIGTTLNSPWQLTVFITVLAATILTGGLAGFFPALKAARLDPAEALRFI
jgi:putative ABC transport system permease protein